jgi:lactoylglutathione lyase
MKVKLGPIIIGVKSIENAKPFYLNVFGIQIKKQSENYLSAFLGSTHIEIEEDSPNRFPFWAERNIGTYKNSEFVVSNMREFLEAVKSNGGTVVNEPVTRPWGSLGAEIADPDGNIFLISQE